MCFVVPVLLGYLSFNDSEDVGRVLCWFLFHCHHYIFAGFSLLFLFKEFLENQTHFFYDYFLTFLAQTWRLRAGRVLVSESATVWMIWASSYPWSSSSSLISVIPSFMCSNLKYAITSSCAAVISVNKVSLRRFLYIFRAACAAIFFLSSPVSLFVSLASRSWVCWLGQISNHSLQKLASSYSVQLKLCYLQNNLCCLYFVIMK